MRAYTDFANNIYVPNQPFLQLIIILSVIIVHIINFFYEVLLFMEQSYFILQNTNLTDKNILEILLTDRPYCIWFKTDEMIQDLLISYGSDFINDDVKYNILKQIDIDFTRSNILINSGKCSKLEFFNFCEAYEKYTHPILESLKYLLLMLATQASFFYPYSLMNTIYSGPDIHIISRTTNDHIIVDVIENENFIDVYFKKSFSCFNANTETELHEVHTNMMLTIELVNEEDGFFFSGRSYCLSNIGIIKEGSSSR